MRLKLKILSALFLPVYLLSTSFGIPARGLCSSCGRDITEGARSVSRESSRIDSISATPFTCASFYSHVSFCNCGKSASSLLGPRIFRSNSFKLFFPHTPAYVVVRESSPIKSGNPFQSRNDPRLPLAFNQFQVLLL